VAAKSLRRTGGRRIAATLRLFNAGLAVHDEQDDLHAYLADALPQLSTESWKVMPDGRMETTYRLKEGLRWHDGTPLTAQDFVFGWRVYATPSLGVAATPPLSYLDEVRADDDRSVTLTWMQPYSRAGTLEAEDFQPLPRHILQGSFEQDPPEAFAAQPFWGDGYVGLGPYTVDRWEPGTFIEGHAFADHALGKPRIDRMRLLFLTDPNAAVAALLSGAAHATIDDPVRLQQATVLQSEWTTKGQGVVLLTPAQVRLYQVQVKAEFAKPRALLDVRARRALVHALDRKAMADGLLDGQSTPAHTLMSPRLTYFADVERAITIYPTDSRRTEQLLGELGYTKGADGLYSHATEGRFGMEVWANAAGQNEAEATVMVDQLRRAGLDASLSVLPQAAVSDAQYRASFPSLTGTGSVVGAEPPINNYRAAQIPSPATRWRGSNRGGWINEEFERLAEAYDTALEPAESKRAIVQLMKVISEEVPAIPLYYNLGVQAHVANLRGPLPSSSTDGAVWKIHEWTFTE
jgi:peptide/nickel transport system substrate-binding protein